MKKRYISANEVETTEETVEVVEKEESKVVGFFKNNWKKLAVGAGVALAGIGGYVLGSSKVETEDDLDLLDLVESDEVEAAEDE